METDEASSAFLFYSLRKQRFREVKGYVKVTEFVGSTARKNM